MSLAFALILTFMDPSGIVALIRRGDIDAALTGAVFVMTEDS
jgi:hypothetical protein